MPRVEKIIARMKTNPRDWRIEDLKIVANHYGIEWRQYGTSHVTFRHPNAEKITVPAHKPIKPIYVREFLKMIAQLEE
jgi:hypothetical protein